MADIIKRIEDLMDLFDEGEVTTANKIQRPSDPFREFEERNPMSYGGRTGFSTAGLVKNLLKKIPDYRADEKNRTAAKKFMKEFLEYSQKKFNGNFKAAAQSIGESREKIKAIFDRVRLSETGTRKGADVGKGGIKQTIIPTPKNVIPYKEATTKVKTDKTFLKNKIKNFDGKKFYNAKDIANILGVDASNKKLLDRITTDLKRFDVTSRPTTGKQKEYNLKDAVNKITKGYEKKLVKGQKLAPSLRYDLDVKLDPDLKRFLGNFRGQTRAISKSEGIFIPGAVEDVGHPLSVKITDKYPNLIKNSNINKINTLTFQDPILNREVLLKTGYESSHDTLLSRLNKIVGKKIGNKELQELQSIKNEMSNLYTQAVNQTKNLAKQNKYFLGQETRIPKIDINIPKQGETFKSENLFVDMSNVNPAFKVGLVDDINPNAKFFKDLSNKQKEIYKRNVLDQTKFNVDKFYTGAGFPKEQVNELKDALEFGTADKIGIATAGTLFGTAAAAEPGVADATGLSMGEKLAGAGTAAAAFKFRKPIIKGAKAVGRTALKALGPLAVPIELGFIGSDLKSGSSTPEALADVVMLGGIFRENEKRKFIKDKYGEEVLNTYVAAKTPGITDVMDIPTAMPELSKRLQTIDAEADQHLLKLREQRAEEFEKKSKLPKPKIDEFQAAGGGIAGLSGGKKSGPPPISGPTPDGDEGLPAGFKRVKKL
tara:strand:+ start:606 stop:2741 length:2136 start_codon:yes stop_codon:yes gene_type:complete